jgi:hypothetical protein
MDIDLAAILSQLGLSRVIDKFRDHTFDEFLKLNDSDLHDLGLNFSLRAKIATSISELKRLFRPEPVTGHFEAAPGAERGRK